MLQGCDHAAGGRHWRRFDSQELGIQRGSRGPSDLEIQVWERWKAVESGSELLDHSVVIVVGSQLWICELLFVHY